ncbi:MFS transporter [Streptomyces sp. NPDC051940]|uniref:MFS transporter n=1 Tax=Streptomyces sp. NPDC051940 TaxID=3155675 RepID=UPI0034299671
MQLRLLLLALGTFAIGTDAMVIAGILPLMARDLDVPIGAAGQVVTVFSLSYAVLAPVVATATGRWPRRRLLLSGLALFTVANALTALAPNYPLLLGTRVLAALGASFFTPAAVTVAAMLAPPERRGRALALVMGGMTVATVIGVPLGTWIGSSEWRITMWLVSALGALALAGIWALLRAELPVPPAVSLPGRLRWLRDRRVLGAVATTFMFFLAVQIVYIYLAPLVAPVTHGDGHRLSALMFVSGVASVVGMAVTGRLVDRIGNRPTLIAAGVWTTLGPVALPWASRDLTAAFVYSALAPLLAWGIVIALQHRLSSVDAAATPLLLSLNASALYLGTAAAGGTGSAAISVLGERWFPLASAGLAALATVLAVVTGRTRGAGRSAAGERVAVAG